MSPAASTTLINPSDETVLQEVTHTTLEQVDEAVAHAVEAQRSWAALAPAERAGALRQFAAAVDAHVEELAQLEVRNSGHPIGSARWEAGHVRDVLNYYAGAPERMIGQQIPVAGGMDVTFHEPLGVVGVIVPWNFPMTIASWGFAPALAAGNAVLLKPADWTPLTAIRLGEIARRVGAAEAPLPGAARPRVGRGGAVRHPRAGAQDRVHRIDRGRQAGRRRMRRAGQARHPRARRQERERGLRRLGSREGGRDGAGVGVRQRRPGLLRPQPHPGRAQRAGSLPGACWSPPCKAFKVGSPADESTEMGPLVSKAHRESVQSFLDGPDAKVAFRGSAPEGPGYWMPPTVLLPASRSDRVATEEIFGPVVSVLPFDDEADAIALANDSVYGLSGSIWTNDLGRAIRVARGIESGTLSVNSHSSVRYTTPFGGAKQSGLGRELGPDAALAFTDTKNVFFAS